MSREILTDEQIEAEKAEMRLIPEDILNSILSKFEKSLCDKRCGKGHYMVMAQVINSSPNCNWKKFICSFCNNAGVLIRSMPHYVEYCPYNEYERFSSNALVPLGMERIYKSSESESICNAVEAEEAEKTVCIPSCKKSEQRKNWLKRFHQYLKGKINEFF